MEHETLCDGRFTVQRAVHVERTKVWTVMLMAKYKLYQMLAVSLCSILNEGF